MRLAKLAGVALLGLTALVAAPGAQAADHHHDGSYHRGYSRSYRHDGDHRYYGSHHGYAYGPHYHYYARRPYYPVYGYGYGYGGYYPDYYYGYYPPPAYAYGPRYCPPRPRVGVGFYLGF